MRNRSIAAACAFVSVISCGLIDPDITKVGFDLPPRTYSFDAAQLNLPAGATMEVPCGPGQTITDCCAPPAPLPAPNCAMTPIVCEAGLCTARITIVQSQTMDLANEVPVLRDLPSFGSVSISRITYMVLTNTLNVASPEMEIFLAPAGVTDPDDPSANPPAKKFGTVPAIPAGSTEAGMVLLEGDAAATFQSFASDLAKPFNFIVRSRIDVPSGSPIPAGKIELSVTGRLAVSI
jgi:hypothetical protein